MTTIDATPQRSSSPDASAGGGAAAGTMTGADALAEVLKREGTQQVFFFPASPIAEAIAKAGIRLILTRQERVAGNMADGVSRSTNGRQIGVFAVQELAGSENAFPGVAHSFTDSTPTLYLPGSPGRKKFGEHPTFMNEPHYELITKYSASPLTAEEVPYRLRQAYQALRSGRPQPAMVDMTEDVADQAYPGTLDYRPVAAVRSAADSGAVKEAADRLLRAKLPLLWAGNGVLYAEASPELTELAELLGAPVMTTLMGKSAFNERHELSVGTGAHAKTGAAMHFIGASDLVLAVGTSLSQSAFTPAIPPDKVLIHATNDPRDLNKVYATDIAIAADAKLFLRQLVEELRSRVGATERERRPEVVRTIASQKAAWRAEYESEFSDEGTPINGYRMFRELWNSLDPDTTMLTHESGASRDIQCVFYESTVPRSYLGWGHSTQLGFSLGLAMGAKLANPSKTVVNVMGDGAIGMTGMDLETAARENIPILTVIKHDGVFSGYPGMFPQADARYHAIRQGGDYAALARALGWHGERVESPSELRAAFGRGLAAVRDGQPALVDVITKETTRLSTFGAH
jgi:thiamine pyrophosphate-dependent acetolactate synthase large subunit-like protein